jgi:hypothetical protein
MPHDYEWRAAAARWAQQLADTKLAILAELDRVRMSNEPVSMRVERTIALEWVLKQFPE